FLRTAGELFAGGSYDQVEERCREFLATHPRYEIITRCGELARAAGQASSDGDNSRHWITSWCLESSPADQDLLLRFGLAEESKPDDGERISPRSPIGLARPESRSAADLGALNRMRATRISLAFTKAPLTEVVAFLREFTSLNMLIDPRSLPTLSDIRVTLTVEELPFESVLSLMLKMHHLSYHVADGIIVVTAERESGNGLTENEEREDMTCFIPDASSSDPGLLPGAARTRGPGSLTFNVRDLPLTCMAAYLTEQTGVAIRIDAESVPNPGALRVTLCAERLALTAVLDQLCAPLGLCAVPEANGILVRQAPER
ncbi:MAG: hypothetical protein HZA54_03640, partial [Planctomycetes bacterium]|nr:hypothetical protein [Planctomycetota bacterium]